MGRSGLRAAPGSAVPGRLRRLALPAALAGASAISAVAGFSVASRASWALLALSLACTCAFVLTARRGRRARRAALAALAAVAALVVYLATAPVDPSGLPRSMGVEFGVRLGSGAQGGGEAREGAGGAWYGSRTRRSAGPLPARTASSPRGSLRRNRDPGCSRGSTSLSLAMGASSSPL